MNNIITEYFTVNAKFNFQEYAFNRQVKRERYDRWSKYGAIGRDSDEWILRIETSSREAWLSVTFRYNTALKCACLDVECSGDAPNQQAQDKALDAIESHFGSRYSKVIENMSADEAQQAFVMVGQLF